MRRFVTSLHALIISKLISTISLTTLLITLPPVNYLCSSRIWHHHICALAQTPSPPRADSTPLQNPPPLTPPTSPTPLPHHPKQKLTKAGWCQPIQLKCRVNQTFNQKEESHESLVGESVLDFIHCCEVNSRDLMSWLVVVWGVLIIMNQPLHVLLIT